MAEFAIPEFPAGAKGEVAVTLQGHSRRFPVTLDPAKKWNLFLVPHTHLDVGYTDYQAKVAEDQSRTLDEAIQMIHDHPDFCFSPDGFWCVQQFLASRTEEQKQLLFQDVKDKKIFVPLNEASLLTGFPALETLIRSLYPSHEFNQKHGGAGDYANITDVPSYSWSYASVMAAAGLKYFAAGSDNYRAPILLQGRLHEKSPFWWEGPDGGRILMWYSRHYLQMQYFFGLPPLITGGHDSIPLYLQIYSRPDYKSDATIIYGTQVENTDLFPQQATLVDEWNKVYAYPHMKYSGFAEAIRYIAGQFGDSVPVERGDGGPYWEDGIASTARSAALERSTEQRVLAAEKFATISSLVNLRLRPDTQGFKQAWGDMVLYDEHTWGDNRSVSNPHCQEAMQQLAMKEAFAGDASVGVDRLLRRSLAALADYISDPQGTLLVFNPLNWQRSNLVEVDLDKGLELVDLTTQQAVPYEILSTGPGYHHIRFLARDVPSVGYKAYAMKPAPETPPVPPSSTEGTVENRYYRVVLDPESGAVKSIFDKELNKELVNTSSPYRFNQYLYVTGADRAPNRALLYSPSAPAPDFSIHGANGGRLVSVTQQPFGVVARLESQGVNTPKVETEVILFNDQKPGCDHTAPPPHFGDIGQVEVETFILRQLVAGAAAHNIETFGIGLHQAIFDAVMDHLDEMARTHRPGMQIAIGDSRIAAFAARRLVDVARARRQRREDRIKPVHRRLVAADHHAIAALQSPDAAGGAAIDIGDILFGQRLGAADIVLVKRVAAVDHDVAGRQQLAQLGNRVFGDLARRQHHPDGTRRLQFLDQVREAAAPAAPVKRRHRLGLAVEGHHLWPLLIRRRPILAPIRPRPIMPICMKTP